MPQKRIDHREVQLKFYNDGVNGVEELLNEGVSDYVFKKALSQMRKNGNNRKAEEFSSLLRRYGILTNRQGPRKPVPGDIRRYRTQDVKGALFVRLPVHTLGVTNGEEVEVKFLDNALQVSVP
jgi:hypothetical protein